MLKKSKIILTHHFLGGLSQSFAKEARLNSKNVKFESIFLTLLKYCVGKRKLTLEA